MRSRWLGPLLALALGGVSAALFSRLPARLPVHWNLAGEPDRWVPKAPGAFLPALTVLGLWLLALVLPRLDPKRANYPRFRDTYWRLFNLVLLLVAVVNVASQGAEAGWPIDGGRVVLLAIGVFLVGIGNSLPRVRPNWWLGVRTPWTLSSDRIWQQTHRVAGWSTVLAGLAVLLAALAPARLRVWALAAATLGMVVVPVVYSFVLWLRRPQAEDHPERETVS